MWNPMVRCRGRQTQTCRISWKRDIGLLSRWTGKSGRHFSSSISTTFLCRWVWYQKIGDCSHIFSISHQNKQVTVGKGFWMHFSLKGYSYVESNPQVSKICLTNVAGKVIKQDSDDWYSVLFFPLQFRVLFANLIALFWNAYLTSVRKWNPNFYVKAGLHRSVPMTPVCAF